MTLPYICIIQSIQTTGDCFESFSFIIVIINIAVQNMTDEVFAKETYSECDLIEEFAQG